MKYIYALIVIAVVSSIQIASAATLSSDSFGECVTEEFLDSPGAFSKFSEMPRTCVGDCEEVTASEFHYDILGRKPTHMEYDAFLREQDAVCPVSTPRARFTDEELMEWVFADTELGERRRVPPRVNGNGNGNGNGHDHGHGNGHDHDHGNGHGHGGGSDPGVPAVPVPAPFILLASGLVAIFARKFF